ncbi:hypothetical protein [Pectobacterium aquaticum]|uniref:hypothetical protein n=1 Tax=Pectobacterium aquaticum TaxID=2204145 RepID=UPI000E2516F7|nr:hypothetical protein [Pectobacterium aquaticum]RRO04869.1 hypothetical protein DMB83_002570 [Pectobacterium aquaticum]
MNFRNITPDRIRYSHTALHDMAVLGVDVAYLKSAPEDFKPQSNHKYAWLQKGVWLVGTYIKEYNGDYSFFAEYAEESALTSCAVTDLDRPLCIAHKTEENYHSDDELLKREIEKVEVEDDNIYQIMFRELKELASK